MYRFLKLIWIIFVLWIVCFLIADEKNIQVEIQDNRIVFIQQEKQIVYNPKSELFSFYTWSRNLDLQWGEACVYSQSTKYISFYKWLQNSEVLRLSAGIEAWISAILSQKDGWSQIYTEQTWKKESDSTRVAINEDNSVTNILSSNRNTDFRAVEYYELSKQSSILNTAVNPKDLPQEYTWYIPDANTSNDDFSNKEVAEYTWIVDFWIVDTWNLVELNTWALENIVEIGDSFVESDVDEYDEQNEYNEQNEYDEQYKEKQFKSVEKYTIKNQLSTLKLWVIPTRFVNPYTINSRPMQLSNWTKILVVTRAVTRYTISPHIIQLKDWSVWEVSPNYKIDDGIDSNSESWSLILEEMLKDEEIDTDSLESENDEFLQKVFEKNQDPKIMNLIVENYINEYQFTKAKKFIEELPDSSYLQLEPALHLRVAFNSFPLTSQTTVSTLTELVKNYQSKNQISNEEAYRYLWILELMDKNYDKFFETAKNFTTEKYKAFAEKIQSLTEEVAKQKWIPDYYLDTLMAVELFNQWFFQPSKVIAISVLTQNSNYILPYQLLGYANFLTNSRDTAIEYFKKLVDLDPNNAEKYHFLMWVSYYRWWKYEQSVVMLSLIKEGSLRLDSERYLIRNYMILDQKNKLLSSRWRLLWYDDLTASDFYTYFYEAFYHPYADWAEFQIYAFDTGLWEKMIRVCNLVLSENEKGVCEYWEIWRDIALGKFETLEESLLNLVWKYPQSYLYHALGEYYLKQDDTDTARMYLLKAVSLTQTSKEKWEIKKLLQNAMD